MPACMKSIASLLLFVGVLSLFTVSAQGKNVTVTIVVPQRLKYEGVLKIVGNSSELGNSNAAGAPVMTPTTVDVWFLIVTLTGGETYQLNVVVLPQGAFFDCYCRPTDPHVFTVPSEGDTYMEVLTGYECNNIPCPLVQESKMFNHIRSLV